MATPKRIYLAGPEVFFPPAEHQAIVAEKKLLLRAAGMLGVDPLDAELALNSNRPKRDQGFEIYRANRALMDSCDGLIANLTPFRGISADPGTVFEIGYMIGQGKPAIGFTLDSRLYHDRAGGASVDASGHVVEDFDLHDNLMIECGLRESGGEMLIADGRKVDRYFDGELFNQCVKLMASRNFR